jgi:hypothetical protein
MLIGVLGLVMLMSAPEEPKVDVKPPRPTSPRQGSYEEGGPVFSLDDRHLELTVYADPGKVDVRKVELRPGVARAYLADSSRLRLRLLDAKGTVLRESGVPNPLSMRVYARRGDGSLYPADTVEGPPPDRRPHDTLDLDEATLTIVLPLRPELTTVSLGWIDVGLVDRDVTKEIRDFCAKDGSPACLAWMKANP